MRHADLIRHVGSKAELPRGFAPVGEAAASRGSRVLGHLVGGPPRIGAPVTVTAITVGAAAGQGGPGLVYGFRVR